MARGHPGCCARGQKVDNAAPGFDASCEVPARFKPAYRGTHRAFVNPCATGDPRNRWPATPVVPRPVGESEKYQTIDWRRAARPRGCHMRKAHPRAAPADAASCAAKCFASVERRAHTIAPCLNVGQALRAICHFTCGTVSPTCAAIASSPYSRSGTAFPCASLMCHSMCHSAALRAQTLADFCGFPHPRSSID